MTINSRRSRLILLCGLPGSGKTILAEVLAKRPSTVWLSPDRWMSSLGMDIWDEVERAKIEKLQWELCKELLCQGLTVVLDPGSWARAERDEMRLSARQLGASVELRYLSAPLEILYERVRRRGREEPAIEFRHILEWNAMFQAPTEQELSLYDPPIEADIDGPA